MILPSRVLLAARSSEIYRIRRQDNQPATDESGTGPNKIVIGVVIVVIVLFLGIIAFALLRASHRNRRSVRKPQPGVSLTKRLRFWSSKPSRGEYTAQLEPGESSPTRRRTTERNSRGPSPDRASGPDVEREANATEQGVDRHTSVRSVMTLPAYTPAARPTELILGREGERAGIDVVLEYPESTHEEEARRDEEMESLYQIRRARREEAAEREERRRLRREARARGDLETVRRLQDESRRRLEQDPPRSAQLIAEHRSASRDRRVSAVQYGALGVARHDGSRIRANSTDSDNRPLLDSAASISSDSMRAGAGVGAGTTGSLATHHRGRSGSSVLSAASTAAPPDEDDDYDVISLEATSRSPSIVPPPGAADDSPPAVVIPTEEPPRYDNLGWGEAPPYESPATPTVPRLAPLGALPSIEITAVSPVSRPPSAAPAVRAEGASANAR
ncbi:hypothetical protein EJ06DRAFT_16180 [Trichodelitschia bisporula]|uniref:Uncharacterized protein n=1 Tax=Trichodelitschia bisporula TaxID=703511 RepID=A0A6G1IAN3_9PEZI|nr:hypothetical protein EJ06DRAFT_16180 [Trichodelitschia bisporula]